MKVCSGGIVGLGEDTQDRIGLLHELATLPYRPVPINMLVPIEGTPLAKVEKLDVIGLIDHCSGTYYYAKELYSFICRT